MRHTPFSTLLRAILHGVCALCAAAPARAAAALVIAPALLAGCSGMPSWSSAGSTLGMSETPDRNRACPQVTVLRDAGKITRYRPGARPGTAAPARRTVTGASLPSPDVEVRGVLGEIEGSCTYDDTGVTIDMGIDVVVQKGAALNGVGTSLGYFVAVIDPEQRVVRRETFEAAFTFPSPEAGSRTGSREELRQHIPLAAGQDARQWQVMLGFELTPAQVDENRRPIPLPGS